MSRTQSSRARERFTTLGADEPDQLIGVAAGELLEWGWLIGALADWLADAPDSTGADAVATVMTLGESPQCCSAKFPTSGLRGMLGR